MRFFKGFAIVLIGLFVVITLMSLLMPSTVIVHRTVIINEKTSSVLPIVKNLDTWKEWHPFFVQPGIANLKSTPESIQWNVNGKAFELKLDQQSELGVRLVFTGNGDKVINDVSVTAADNQAQAEWKAITKISWLPWEKFAAIFTDDITGPGYEQALNGLKNYIESQQTR